MNKQFVIAALLAGTQAADCVDAYYNLALAEQKAAKAYEVTVKGLQQAADAALVKEKENSAALLKEKEPIDLLLLPFTTDAAEADAAAKKALDADNLAQANLTGEHDIVLSNGAVSALGLWHHAGVVMTVKTQQTGSTGLETAHSKAKEAIVKADGELKKLVIAETAYDAELVRRSDQQKLYQTATTAAEAAVLALDAAKAKKTAWTAAKALTLDKLNTLELQQTAAAAEATKAIGLADIQAIAYALQGAAQKVVYDGYASTALKAMNDEYAKVAALKQQLQEIFLRDKVYKMSDACGSDLDKCKVGSESAVQLKAYEDSIKTHTTAVALYEQKRLNYVRDYQQSIKLSDLLASLTYDRDLKGQVFDADVTAKTTAESADVDSKKYLASAKLATANAEMACKKVKHDIVLKKAEVTRLKNNAAIAEHIKNEAADLFLKLKAKKDAAKDLKAHSAATQVITKAALDQATDKLKVYKDQWTAATQMEGDSKKEAAKYALMVKTATGSVNSATSKVAAALANCKGVKYREAQRVWADWTSAEQQRAKQAADVKKDYDIKYAPPTDGAAGTRCEYPKPAEDGTQGPRPPCADELCCGAANKYMRDGTRLTVETCQKEKVTHTYKFLPKLMPGATVAPTPELWRFYCIEGAQKLAATLAAGLGAAYFMA